MKTVITIEIDHDKLNQKWQKDIDTHMGSNNLAIYQSYAWHLLESAVSSELATTKVEVKQ
jgi:hypothetical protein